MSCTKCGSRTTRSRVCKQCALDERYTPARDDTSQSVVTYECTGCGAHYRTDGSDKCPECGSQRRRYAGELAPDGGTVQACPECESSSVFPTPGGIEASSEGDWRCDDCEARFDDVIERDSNGGGHTSVPGQKLLNADPDEVLSDGGEDPTRVGHVISDGDAIDTYAGRGSGRKAMGDVPVGTRGWLGNPYVVAEHGREEAIERFREHFERRLDADAEFREAVRDLAGDVLGCFCQTLTEDEPACHAEIIAEHVDRLRAAADEDDDAEPHRLADAEPRTQPGDDGDGEPHRLAGAEPRTQPSNGGDES